MSKCMQLLLCILHTYTFFHLAYSADALPANENTAVTLTCPSANRVYILRQWYRGYFTRADTPPPLTSVLFSQTRQGALKNFTSRPDMAVDPTSFALTIRRVWLEDDGNFTCRVFDGVSLQNLYNQTRVEVYIQPTIELTGLIQTHKENDTVTVACTIDRLYPQIQPADFTMTWGDTVREAVSVKNNAPDKSYRYRVQITKTLTKEDNRMTVTCNVNPVRGTPVSEQRTLNVHYITSDSPSISVDQEHPYLEDSVTFTCDKGNVEGNPAVSKVGWYKDDHPTNWSLTSFTIKRKVTLEYSGIYKCVVGNIIGFSGFSNSVYLNVSSVVIPSASKSNIVPAAVGGTLGVLTIIVIIIIVIVVMYYRKNRKKGGTVQPAVVKDDGYLTPVPLSDDSVYDEIIEPTANTNRDQQGVSHQPCAEIYEEIEDKPQTGFQGAHIERQGSLHDYESLVHDKKWNFEVWVQENELPPVIIARLQKEELVTLKPLQKLSKDDLAELGLPMGHRVILKDALKNLMKQLE